MKSFNTKFVKVPKDLELQNEIVQFVKSIEFDKNLILYNGVPMKIVNTHPSGLQFFCKKLENANEERFEVINITSENYEIEIGNLRDGYIEHLINQKFKVSDHFVQNFSKEILVAVTPYYHYVHNLETGAVRQISAFDIYDYNVPNKIDIDSCSYFNKYGNFVFNFDFIEFNFENWFNLFYTNEYFDRLKNKNEKTFAKIFKRGGHIDAFLRISSHNTNINKYDCYADCFELTTFENFKQKLLENWHNIVG